MYDLCWSSDSRYIISGSVDNSAIAWDTQKGEDSAACFTDNQTELQFSDRWYYIVAVCSGTLDYFVPLFDSLSDEAISRS